jgi:hypothetical protein
MALVESEPKGEVVGVHSTQVYPQIKELLQIPHDEPIFILRAQDQTSVDTLDHYISENETEGNDPSWLEEMRKVANEFEDWQIKNSRKIKRAD